TELLDPPVARRMQERPAQRKELERGHGATPRERPEHVDGPWVPPPLLRGRPVDPEIVAGEDDEHRRRITAQDLRPGVHHLPGVGADLPGVEDTRPLPPERVVEQGGERLLRSTPDAERRRLAEHDHALAGWETRGLDGLSDRIPRPGQPEPQRLAERLLGR